MISVRIPIVWAGVMALSVDVAMAQGAEPSSHSTPRAQDSSSHQQEGAKDDRMGRGKDSDWAGQRKQPSETQSAPERNRDSTRQRDAAGAVKGSAKSN